MTAAAQPRATALTPQLQALRFAGILAKAQADLGRDVSAGTVRLLLIAYTNGHAGVGRQTLMRELRLADSSLSLLLRGLGAGPRRNGTPGLGLVEYEREIHPETDNLVWLTKAGRAAVKRWL